MIKEKNNIKSITAYIINNYDSFQDADDAYASWGTGIDKPPDEEMIKMFFRVYTMIAQTDEKKREYIKKFVL